MSYPTVPDHDLFFYHNDHLGTPLALTDENKTVRWKAQYYPFGELHDEYISTSNFIRFPGQWEDTESELHYNWNRYYNTDLGRYISPDPIKLAGGINMYSYVSGNPINYIDPWGLYDNSCEETAEFLRKISMQTYSQAVINHDRDGIYDFKSRYKFDTFIVNGVRMKADEFGNFTAGFVAESVGGGKLVKTNLMYWGVRFAGIAINWAGAVTRGSEWNLDIDSIYDIDQGFIFARKLRLLNKESKFFKCSLCK